MSRAALVLLVACAAFALAPVAQAADAQGPVYVHGDITPTTTCTTVVVDTPLLYHAEGGCFPTLCVVWPYRLLCV